MKRILIIIILVTAIFPSITYASWAAIFTGEQAGKTGILGNEFFDRTTQNMVTFSDGAFKMMNIFNRYPLNPNNTSGIGAPDKTLSSGVQTVYEAIKAIKPELESVTVMHNYSRGADKWLYQESLIDKLRFAWNYLLGDQAVVAKLMDSSPADDSVNYINKLIFEKKKFPILFAVYFAGLDHYAHDEGMDTYTQFLRENSDRAVEKVVKALTDNGEFDNKIFVITADHGHTAMPTNLTYKDKNWLGMEVERPAEMSCKLKLEFGDPDNPDTSAQNAELNNNNLHIWEMGDFLKIIGEVVEQTTGIKLNNKVLAPTEIARLFKDPETSNPLPNGAAEKTGDATVIAAFNGPMAHIYVKGSDWSTTPDINKVNELAEIFRVTLQGAMGGDSPLSIFPQGVAGRLGYRIGRLSNSIDEILVRDGGVYKVYTVNNSQVVLKDISNYFTDEYIDSEIRIKGMNHEKRSGDIVLIMKDSMTDTADKRYTTGSACKSWHGSLNPSDSYVPLIVSYPGGNKKEIEDILKKDTLCKTDYSECKGNWKLTDIVKEIISEQYK